MSAAEPQAAAASSPVDILHVATLVLAASRLIGGLANLPLFKNAQVSLTEWLALSVVADKEGFSNKMLARSLGVTGQRANQLCTSLNEAKLISITQSKDDSRRNVIRITDAGRQQLSSLNSQLQDLVTVALKGKRRSLIVAGKHLRFLMRIVLAGNPQLAAKRSKKRGKLKASKEGARDAASSNGVPPDASELTKR